jgi:hypothetical protein
LGHHYNLIFYCENKDRFEPYESDEKLKKIYINGPKNHLPNCSDLYSKISDSSNLITQQNLLKKQLEADKINILSLKMYALDSQNVLNMRNFFTFLKEEIPNIIEYLLYQKANVVAMIRQCKNENILALIFYLNK